jgi:hypothetical protein
MRALLTAILLTVVGSGLPCLAMAQNPPPDSSGQSPPPVDGGVAPPTTPSTPAAPNPHDSLIGNAPTDRSAVAKKEADDRRMKRCMAREKSLHAGQSEEQMKQSCQKQLAAKQQP